MALRGVSGSLVSAAVLATATGQAAPAGDLRRLLLASAGALGPASSARQVFDLLLLPAVRALGIDGGVTLDAASAIAIAVDAPGVRIAIAAAAGWNTDLNRLRWLTCRGVRELPRWWIGTNGVTLRVVDVSRAYARRMLDFDLGLIVSDDRAIEALRIVFERGADGALAGLERIVEESERHRAATGRSLQSGVEGALSSLTDGFQQRRGRPVAREAAHADALTVVYRILFLLFAEARGLVPHWHPIYRDSYTIESLRPIVESGRATAGLWQSLQAIARLAHRGCSAGTLRVFPFNGRLFSPATAPLAESLALDDRVVRDVLLAVTTRREGDRRARISYADLGVEQLGAVYERVLDPDSGRGTRKASGTFYTPRSITEYLVRRTLAPLVRARSPEDILALRVLDPAMGSGAFLVAACRYLASAYEEALIEEGAITRADVTPADRAAFRRAVALKCLYGVDLNSTAVQLARLSLWLCTLAAERPLSFLDHHLRAGNSLAGSTAADVARQPPGRGRRSPSSPLPLLDEDDLSDRLRSAVQCRLDVAAEPDETADAVRRKERVIDALQGAAGPLAAWRAVRDAWCAAWFWPPGHSVYGPREWPAFSAELRGSEAGMPDRLVAAWRDTASHIAIRERFFHWELEFPEMFFDDRGLRLARAGFDAVIGNPPWTAAGALQEFSRESGCYRLQSAGHANLYQLFAERMLQLAAPDGRVGMLMPAGILADQGCARLREELFSRTAIDAVVGFDNHDAIFPIHRGLKFVLLTATRAGDTRELPLRAGLRCPDELDDVPDEGAVPGSIRVPLTLIRRFSGPGHAVPEIHSELDRSILAGILARVPALSSEDGWNVTFGRELNATDDRGHFGSDGYPVLEGKLLDQFVVDVAGAKARIDPSTARRLLGTRVDRPRLGYREVAAASNRLTLIAAMLPARTVSTHTIFCLKHDLPLDAQWCLCGLLNGFVANYLVRLRGGTHVPAGVMRHLPVPRPADESPLFARIAAHARAIADRPGDGAVRARLHAATTRAYGLDERELRHILQTFPLVAQADRDAAATAFCAEEDAI